MAARIRMDDRQKSKPKDLGIFSRKFGSLNVKGINMSGHVFDGSSRRWSFMRSLGLLIACDAARCYAGSF